MKATKFAMAAALALSAFAANAALVTVNLASGGTDTGYAYGNVRTFTDAASGVTVTASAWALTGGSSNTKFETAYLGQYVGGLGVCNKDEYCNSSNHRVDNKDRFDFVLFQFSAAVDPTSVKINPAGEKFDLDASYWTGTTNNLSLGGKLLTDLGGLGLVNRVNNSGIESKFSRDVPIENELNVNSMLFGASALSNDRDDWFKITSITFDYTKPTPPAEVPEPGSLALIALALGGLGLARRRRAA